MSMHANRWVVGLDLRPSGQGALRFAHWLAQATPEDRPTFVGVHVMVENHLRAALRYHHLDELIAGAREQAQMLINNASAGDVLSELHVVQGRHAEESLEAARVYHHAEGLIVGRLAPREGHHVFRLGKVARRILRRLDAPVVVVPPDWDPQQTPEHGPILCATNLGPGAELAASFAAETAKRLGRRLMLVHTVPIPEDYGANYIPQASRDKIAEEYQTEGTRELGIWASAQGLADAEQEVRQGHVTEQVLEVVRHTHAAMLVTGSRRLSTMERWLLSSVASELAATSPCPVAVVGPPPSGC